MVIRNCQWNSISMFFNASAEDGLSLIFALLNTIGEMGHDVPLLSFYFKLPFQNESILIKSSLINPLNANPEKWSNTPKQIVGNLPTICLSVFDHFMNLALKVLIKYLINQHNN